MNDAEATVFAVLAIIAAALGMMWMAMANRRQLREMVHRERLAMIERGLVPPPEVDPAGFESRAGFAPQFESRAAVRSRSAGVLMIGLGLALMLMISLLADESVGIAVGGGFALIGAAFLFNSMLLTRHSYEPPPPPSPRIPRAPGGSEPPSNVAP